MTLSRDLESSEAVVGDEIWKPSRFYPQLDGLRAVAVALVLLRHMDKVQFPNWIQPLASIGWMGVDVFFVLSGFLITSILLRREPSFRSFGIFVARRTLRTWPLYFVSLLFAFFLLRNQPLAHSIPWLRYVIFIQNYNPAYIVRTLKPTWSLCVEEHFYLIWPFLVFLLPRRAILWCIPVIFAAMPFLRYWGVQSHFTEVQLYTETQFHLDGLMVGSFIAAMLMYFRWRRVTLIRIAVVTFVIGIALSFAWFRGTADLELGNRILLGFTTTSIAFGGLVLFLLAAGDAVLSKALSFKPIQYVGRISYGIYLLHGGVFGLFEKLATRPGLEWIDRNWFLGLAVRWVLVLAIASVSYRFFESPILRWKDRFGYRKAATPTEEVTVS